MQKQIIAKGPRLNYLTFHCIEFPRETHEREFLLFRFFYTHLFFRIFSWINCEKSFKLATSLEYFFWRLTILPEADTALKFPFLKVNHWSFSQFVLFFALIFQQQKFVHVMIVLVNIVLGLENFTLWLIYGAHFLHSCHPLCVNNTF